MSRSTSFPVLLRIAGIVSLLGLLSGCAGMFHGAGQIGPDLKPHASAGVSIPWGK